MRHASIYTKTNSRYRGPRESRKIDQDRQERIVLLRDANQQYQSLDTSVRAFEKDLLEFLDSFYSEIDHLYARSNDLKTRGLNSWAL